MVLTVEIKLILLKILSCASQRARIMAQLGAQLLPETVLLYTKVKPVILTPFRSILQMQMILMRLSLHLRSRMAR